MKTIRIALASIFVLGAATAIGATPSSALTLGGTAQTAAAAGPGTESNFTRVQYYGGYYGGYYNYYPHYYYPQPRYYYPQPRYYYPPTYYYPRYYNPCFSIYGRNVGANFCF